MLQSMTGYGEAQLEKNAISFLVEIRSLNNRFLKTSIKLPDVLAFAEARIERLIRQELARGSVNFNLHMRYIADEGPFEVNQRALQSYMSALEQTRTLHNNKDVVRIDLGGLLQLPGVCQLREYDQQEHRVLLETVEQLTQQALANLKVMRAEEGKNLFDDLQRHCQSIREHLVDLQGLCSGLVDSYRRRIQERVNAMLADANLELDENLLIKEVAIFAERSDINEELLRLESHLAQFDQACLSDEQSGRRLDFLTQEMLREANTIANKANSAQITPHVIEIKVAVDRLKEQVQNVE